MLYCLDRTDGKVIWKFDDGKKEDRVTLAKRGADAYSARTDDPGAAKIDPTKLDDALKSIDDFMSPTPAAAAPAASPAASTPAK